MNNQSALQHAFSKIPPPPTLLRIAFGIESAAFLTVSTSLIISTSSTLLDGFSRHPTFVTPLALYFARLLGTNGLAIALPLAWGASTYATPREKKGVYYSLLAADPVAVLGGLGMWVAGVDCGLQSGLDWQLALGQAVPMLWRIWCLWGRPQWFESEETERHNEVGCTSRRTRDDDDNDGEEEEGIDDERR